MSQENVETITRLYDEFLARPERVASSEQLAFFDPAVELHQSESILGTEGAFHGYDGLARAMREIFEVFSEVHFVPKRLVDAGDQVVANRAASWTTVILIAGLIPLSQAIQSTGAAADIASILVDVVGGSSPSLFLAGLFALAAAFGVAISNTATALILIPIGLAAAAELDVATAPVLMSLAVASSASFLTPIATPGNMIVMGPGGYRFGDYWRFGLPFLGLFFVVAVFLVPVIWSF